MIQEFSDFQCPFCSRANPVLEQILEEYPKDVKIVWRNMPLAMHPTLPLAAEAAHEVFLQGGNEAFWKCNTAVANQKPRASALEHAQELGGTPSSRPPSTTARIKPRARSAAKQAGVGGSAPAFLVNGYYVRPVAGVRQG